LRASIARKENEKHASAAAIVFDGRITDRGSRSKTGSRCWWPTGKRQSPWPEIGATEQVDQLKR
jgi:hypothetical protein